MIAFFGGSFNPVHYGHLKCATAINKELKLKKTYLMPCAIPIHKERFAISDKDRLKILQLSINKYPNLAIDNREIKRHGLSYTIDSLIEINKQYPNEIIILMLGMDSFISINTWKDFTKLTNYAHILVFKRPNYVIDKSVSKYFDITDNIDELSSNKNGLVYFYNQAAVDISSSDIRNKILNHKSIAKLMPKKAIDFIYQKKLFC